MGVIPQWNTKTLCVTTMIYHKVNPLARNLNTQRGMTVRGLENTLTNFNDELSVYYLFKGRTRHKLIPISAYTLDKLQNVELTKNLDANETLTVGELLHVLGDTEPWKHVYFEGKTVNCVYEHYQTIVLTTVKT